MRSHDFFEAEHRAHGVDIRLGAKVVELEESKENPRRVGGVRLESGESIPAELVIVGIGIDAAVEPLTLAGAASANGVVVDLRCNTSLPDIYAVGDCAAHPNVYANGRVVRLESIQNANDQAMVVAKAIAGSLGAADRYDAVPSFWSNQYDLRLQTVGLSIDHDEVVVRGAPESRSFSVVYLRSGRVVGSIVLSVSAVQSTSEPRGAGCFDLSSRECMGRLATHRLRGLLDPIGSSPELEQLARERRGTPGVPRGAVLGCTADLECKGDRRCVSGACVNDH